MEIARKLQHTKNFSIWEFVNSEIFQFGFFLSEMAFQFQLYLIATYLLTYYIFVMLHTWHESFTHIRMRLKVENNAQPWKKEFGHKIQFESQIFFV